MSIRLLSGRRSSLSITSGSSKSPLLRTSKPAGADGRLKGSFDDSDDILGHAKIRQGLKGHMGVATGEHAHNRSALLTDIR